MNIKKYLPLVSISLINVSLLLLLVFSTGVIVQKESNQEMSDGSFDYEAAADQTAFRWQAMARFYERNGLLNSRTDPDDALTFRWKAMAEFYRDNGLLKERTEPDDALRYRWQAMADFYRDHNLLTRDEPKLSPGDLSAYRWTAMARFYEENDLLTRPLTAAEEELRAAAN